MAEATKIADAQGRTLDVIEMDPADQLDLFEACGTLSANQSWVGMALLACSVKGIDGIPVPMPKKPEHVKALARQLGKAGIDAVAKFLNGPGEKQTMEAVATTAKN